MKTIHEALSYVQKHLRAPKNQFNNFGKYKYRSCEDILEGLKAVMPDGAHVTLSDDSWLCGERYYVKTTATFHFGGENISVSAIAREALTKKGMDESQITGAAASYSGKRALGNLFAIDDSKDADTVEKAHEPERPEPDVAPIVANILQCHQKGDWEFAKTILDDLDDLQKKKVWSALGGPVRIWIQSKMGAK